MSTISRPNDSVAQQSKATPVEDVVSDAGSVDEGALTIGFLNLHATVACTVNGKTLPAGASKTYPGVGKQYISIPYDASGSSLEITAIF